MAQINWRPSNAPARGAVLVDAQLSPDLLAALVVNGYQVQHCRSFRELRAMRLRRPSIFVVANNLEDAGARCVAAWAAHRWRCHAIVVGDPEPRAPTFPPLTERQVEVLFSVSRGSSEPVELARRLNWDEADTRRVIAEICDALGAADWSDAIRRAKRLGLV